MQISHAESFQRLFMMSEPGSLLPECAGGAWPMCTARAKPILASCSSFSGALLQPRNGFSRRRCQSAAGSDRLYDRPSGIRRRAVLVACLPPALCCPRETMARWQDHRHIGLQVNHHFFFRGLLVCRHGHRHRVRVGHVLSRSARSLCPARLCPLPEGSIFAGAGAGYRDSHRRLPVRCEYPRHTGSRYQSTDPPNLALLSRGSSSGRGGSGLFAAIFILALKACFSPS